MLQRLTGRNTLLWIFEKHFLDNVFGFVRYLIPIFGREVNFRLFIGNQYFIYLVAPKRRPATEQHVEDDSSTENINLLIIANVFEQFGPHVARRATSQLQELPILDEGGQSKVSNPEIVIVRLRSKDQILRLQISVHDIVRMQVLQSFEHVSHDSYGCAFLIHLFRLDSVEKLSALEIGEHQVNVFIALIDFMKVDDKLVVKRPQYIYLLQHTLDVPLILFHASLFDCLQGILGLTFLMLGVTSPLAHMHFGEVASA